MHPMILNFVDIERGNQMAIIDKKTAQERVEKFLAELKANGKTWEQYLKERDAEEDKRIIEINKVASKLRKDIS